MEYYRKKRLMVGFGFLLTQAIFNVQPTVNQTFIIMIVTSICKSLRKTNHFDWNVPLHNSTYTEDL